MPPSRRRWELRKRTGIRAGAGTDHVVNLEIAVNDPRLERPPSRLDLVPSLIRWRSGQVAPVPREQKVNVRDRTDGFFRFRVDDRGLRSRELGERTVGPGESVSLSGD
jgi:hypothetical protein